MSGGFNNAGSRGSSPGAPGPRMIDILVGQIVGGPLMSSRTLPTNDEDRQRLSEDVWNLAEALMETKHQRRPQG